MASRRRVLQVLLGVVVMGAAEPADAQRVVLELRPRVGDTLRMRLDQTTEMSGGRRGAPPKMSVTTMHMFSRAIVESHASGYSVILAITDSVNVSASDERARPMSQEALKQLAGSRMRLRLNRDGTVAVADAEARLSKDVSDLISIMPASFPRGSVAVGDTWLREMPIPPSASMGVPLGGLVKAAFRLDSLSSDGQVAYLSMRGSMHPLTEAVAVSDPSALVGSVTGSMIVDRLRGWLSESRFLVEMKANVAALGAATQTPMQFRLKITQHMRIMEKRP
ncbi:MAG TPA: hypothetical protein VEB19_13045 [Gemmatimonadaceae bacterium]|nr:hypothetical protein [Gemmatimonadaceae bacterium]